MIGLNKQFNVNEYLSKAALGGLFIALFISIAVWVSAPTPSGNVDPGIFSNS